MLVEHNHLKQEGYKQELVKQEVELMKQVQVSSKNFGPSLDANSRFVRSYYPLSLATRVANPKRMSVRGQVVVRRQELM